MVALSFGQSWLFIPFVFLFPHKARCTPTLFILRTFITLYLDLLKFTVFFFKCSQFAVVCQLPLVPPSLPVSSPHATAMPVMLLFPVAVSLSQFPWSGRGGGGDIPASQHLMHSVISLCHSFLTYSFCGKLTGKLRFLGSRSQRCPHSAPHNIYLFLLASTCSPPA